MTMKIGILSDTHGLLRPQALDALKGCDLILHGGDINKQTVLDMLNEIAPVHVVRGNNDKEWAAGIPPALDMTIGEIRVYMTHKKKDLPDDLTPYDLVIVGHTHKYAVSRVGNTLLVNPGSCGPRRFDQPITLAIASVQGKSIVVSRIDIPHPENRNGASL